MSRGPKPWRSSYLVFGAPYIGRAEKREVRRCLDSGWIGSGPRAHRLEAKFARHLGARHALALNSGSAALFLALKGLRLKPRSEVIVPSMTFCATANAVVNAGLTPVLVDCERDSMNIDPAEIRRRIGKRTKAVLPVHFAGRPCAMREIMGIARAHGLAVIEDCAHAIEAASGGRRCGTFGDYGAFSFYVTKNMTTGEGGMLVSKTRKAMGRLRGAALHGLSEDAWERFSDDGYVHYAVIEPGYKFNLTDLAASLGLHQLARLEKAYRHRRLLWDFYLRELRELPLLLPAPVRRGDRHARHLFTCLVDDSRTDIARDQVLRRLHQLRIGSGVHYIPVHEHPFYKKHFPAPRGGLPNSAYIGARTFSLPLSYAVSRRDAADVVRALRLIFGSGA
ncbi:MAG: DegT/DnrJ/EryC1/StrS family aminotransferase [Elusimicrobiota bacterium]